jgi:two-component system, NarL family, invasion response regulator UvrY
MRFLIADEHGIFRTGIKQILLEEFPSAMIEEAIDAETVIQKSFAGKLDLITCDLSMTGRSGLDVVRHILNYSTTPVLIISKYPEKQYALQALKAGAAGYLSKDIAIDELRRAVLRILQGRKYISAAIAEKLVEGICTGNSDKKLHELLSSRELDIFKTLAQGKPIVVIAKQFALGISTIRTHRSRIMTKMNMDSNAELTRYALECNLI